MGPPKDAKSNLQEVVQQKFKLSPNYKIIETRGPDHAKEFIVAVFISGKEMGRGRGHSKQIAEEQAAMQAQRQQMLTETAPALAGAIKDVSAAKVQK